MSQRHGDLTLTPTERSQSGPGRPTTGGSGQSDTERVRLALQGGDLDQALGHARRAVARDPRSVEAWDLLARVQLQGGGAAAACEAAEQLVRLAPDLPWARQLLARACKAAGRVDAAIEQYRAAAGLAPSARTLLDLGGALRAAGRWPEAAQTYWHALDLEPVSHEAHLLLGNSLVRVIEQASAKGAFQVPSPDLAQWRQAEDDLAAGRTPEALRGLLRAAGGGLGSPDLHDRIAFVLWQLACFEQALVHNDLAARIRPESPEAWEQAGDLASSLGLVERAAAYFARAQRLRPADDVLIRSALLVPAIEPSPESIEATRERCDRALDELLARPLQVAEPFPRSQLSLLYLTYHGRCNRTLHGKVAKLHRQASPHLAWVAPHTLEARRTDRRLRVGFVSRFLRRHSIGKTTRGLVAELDRERFEVYGIDLCGQPDDVTQDIRRSADHWIEIAPPLEDARERIAALELDVLFYQDIGLEAFSYFLAHARLAHVQCVSYGHPDTTGIPSLDYFISNDLYERPDAAADYSESLFLLQGLPTLAYYHRPPPPGAPDRARLALPEGEHLYLCPQTLFKIHPEFDGVLAAILRGDPQGRILLIRNHCEQWRVQLNERFRRAMPDVAHRISYLPILSQSDFLATLAAVDVVLDTTHFNGMNSSLETFSVGTPVVTLPKSLQRGRHTWAMYRSMEIDDAIARDEDDYAQIALRLGRDAALRADLKRRILERNGVLYENERVTAEFERFFVTAVARIGA